VDAAVTIPFPPDLFEALAQRVAAILSEQPPVQRYMDAEAAARYLGVPVKTLRSREWRDRERIPYGQLDNGRLVFDRLALDERFASCSAAPGGGYTVARIAATALGVGPR
jgi:helix-turn-helix protein